MGADAKPAIPALIRTLSEDELIEVRVEAAHSLGRLGENDAMVVLALTEALKDCSPEVCLAAATELTDADAARPEVAAALHKYAGHTNSWVRRCATDLLQRVSAPDLDPGDR